MAPLFHKELLRNGRRDFLRTTTALGMVSLVSGCSREARWRSEAYRKSQVSRVAILKAGSYGENLVDIVLDALRTFRVGLSGKKVLLKPNLVEYEKDNVINTNPWLIGAAVEACLRLGAGEVRVGEGPGHRRDTDGLLIASGLLEHLKDTRTEFVDLNLDDTRKVTLLSNYMGVDSLHFPETALKADVLISLPKIKTHHWTGMTLSMKNMFGVVPGVKYGWPKNFLHWHGIHESIVDINSTLYPHFVIADGIVAMEGNGPIQGKAKPCGVLVFGDDPVAVDSTCSRMAGLDPERIDYLKLAGEFLGNLAEERILQIGEPLSKVRTQFEVIESFKHLKVSR